MVVLGWALARDVGRCRRRRCFGGWTRATAGTVGFLIRLVFLVVSACLALTAGLEPATLAVGGADYRGRLRSRGPADAGEPDRRHGADLGAAVQGRRPRTASGRRHRGQVEGVVASFGLLSGPWPSGQDSIMVPNNVVLNRGGRAAARAGVGRPARAAAARTSSPVTCRRCWRRPSRRRCARAAHLARGGRPRRGRRPHRRDAVSESDGPKLADEILAAIGA